MLSDSLAPSDFREDLATGRPAHYMSLVDLGIPLLGYRELADLVRHHLLDGARVRLLRSGGAVPQESYSRSVQGFGFSYRVPRPGAVDELLSDGATLVFNGLDEVHDGAAGEARDLEASLGCPVRANVYASFSETPGFALHWDDHDVLVIQVQGSKRWTYAPPSTPYPLRGAEGAFREPERSDVRTADLTAGDGLYLPRGWWHMAQANAGPSLHITWSLSRPTGVDFIAWLAKEAVRHSAARADLPLDGDPLPLLRSALDTVMAEPELIDRFRRYVAARSPDRSVVSFPL